MPPCQQLLFSSEQYRLGVWTGQDRFSQWLLAPGLWRLNHSGKLVCLDPWGMCHSREDWSYGRYEMLKRVSLSGWWAA